MLLDAVAQQGGIEEWVTKWQQRKAKQDTDVMGATKALDECMRSEVGAHMRAEKEVSKVHSRAKRHAQNFSWAHTCIWILYMQTEE